MKCERGFVVPKDRCDYLTFVGCNDDPNTGKAYNLYHCVHCSLIIKENVWDNAGLIIIDQNDTITYERQPKS